MGAISNERLRTESNDLEVPTIGIFSKVSFLKKLRINPLFIIQIMKENL